MNMKNILLALLLFIVSISCTEMGADQDVLQPPCNDYTEFSFHDNVVLFDKSYAPKIDVVNDTTINIDNSIDDGHCPKIGDIIYCESSEHIPYGFIGRVVESSNNGAYTTYTTEEVLLTDIFEELHINTTVELPKDIPYFTDSEGNKYESSSVENDVWDTINDDNKDDNTNNPASRASANLTGSHTTKIAISNSGAFSGHLYINSLLSLRIDISEGKLDEFSYEYNKRCGIVGGLSLSADKGRDFVLVNRTIMLPFSIAVGPLLLTTDFNIKCGLNCSAETKVEGELNFEFDNSTAKFSYNNGSPTYEVFHADVSQNKHLSLSRFETTMGVDIYFDTAMEMACYHRNILAVGAGVKGEYNISVNNEIAYSNTELLKINPYVTISPEVEAGVFCRSKLFKWSGDEEEFGIYRSFGFASFELPIFPEFYNFVTETANNNIKATAKLIKKNYIKTSEEGFALFKRDCESALEHKKISSGTRSGETSVLFDVDNQDEYVIKPYIISDDTYFYGEEYDDKWVDLGLSVLWAKYNVGANSPEEYGGYYAWGEIEEKDEYSWDNYLYGKIITSYDGERKIIVDTDKIDNIISGTKHDAAHIYYHEKARMPYGADIEELFELCSCNISTMNGVNGIIIIGPNGNSIFIPFAGCKVNGDIYDNCKDAYIWHGALTIEDNTYIYTPSIHFTYDDGQAYMSTDIPAPSIGISIRAVKDIHPE